MYKRQGDEIVAVDAEISSTQIRNSNSYSLAVQIQNCLLYTSRCV